MNVDIGILKMIYNQKKIIDDNIKDDNFKYLFIDEIQNVKNYEPLINGYRETGNLSQN